MWCVAIVRDVYHIPQLGPFKRIMEGGDPLILKVDHKPEYKPSAQIHVTKIMWQSGIENEHYSVAYFNRTRTFKALYLRTSVKGEYRDTAL